MPENSPKNPDYIEVRDEATLVFLDCVRADGVRFTARVYLDWDPLAGGMYYFHFIPMVRDPLRTPATHNILRAKSGYYIVTETKRRWAPPYGKRAYAHVEELTRFENFIGTAQEVFVVPVL